MPMLAYGDARVTQRRHNRLTIGIDIGSAAVKAVAADADGHVTARVRIDHRLRVPAPDRLEHGIVEQMPSAATIGAAAGQVPGTEAVLATGTIDALCEQIVAGAEGDSDVLVLCGTTLVVWTTIPEARQMPRFVDHSAYCAR